MVGKEGAAEAHSVRKARVPSARLQPKRPHVRLRRRREGHAQPPGDEPARRLEARRNGDARGPLRARDHRQSRCAS